MDPTEQVEGLAESRAAAVAAELVRSGFCAEKFEPLDGGTPPGEWSYDSPAPRVQGVVITPDTDAFLHRAGIRR